MNTAESNFQNWINEIQPSLETKLSPTSINALQVAIKYIEQAIADYEKGNINFATNNLETSLSYSRFISPELSSLTIKGIKILRDSQCEIRPTAA
jgi:DNA mismatch repair ATPase MutS